MQTTTSAQPTLEILSVNVCREYDHDADTSYLDPQGDPELDAWNEIRREQLDRGAFSYIGIYATAEVMVCPGLGQMGRHEVQDIRSGGLWGIEDDSNPAYLMDVAQEELDDLREQLEALGIPAEEVTEAINLAHW